MVVAKVSVQSLVEVAGTLGNGVLLFGTVMMTQLTTTQTQLALHISALKIMAIQVDMTLEEQLKHSMLLQLVNAILNQLAIQVMDNTDSQLHQVELITLASLIQIKQIIVVKYLPISMQSQLQQHPHYSHLQDSFHAVEEPETITNTLTHFKIVSTQEIQTSWVVSLREIKNPISLNPARNKHHMTVFVQATQTILLPAFLPTPTTTQHHH